MSDLPDPATMSTEEKLARLITLVDEHFEYSLPWRTWQLMQFVEQLRPDHLGWSTEEVCDAWAWEAKSRAEWPENWGDA